MAVATVIYPNGHRELVPYRIIENLIEGDPYDGYVVEDYWIDNHERDSWIRLAVLPVTDSEGYHPERDDS